MAISSTQEDENDDIDVWFDHDDDHHQPHPHNLSMFSMSISSMYSSDDDDDDMGMYMSRLSPQSFEADADEELSGEELLQLSSDSDKEPCYYSLPAIPTHRRNRTGVLNEMRSNRKKKDGVVVITRPRGGRRTMCMDMEEVKACRDLGFELEHERVLEMPFSSVDNASSGANSPNSNWLISGPGDDPRDVKARLKVWAQAVARASTSMHCS
ncbi:hypothetical protein V6N13_131965 [Hibiscus sabdariffa]